ncbi:zinc-binding dehydrogenase [Inquilinus sp. Marseille-Q2685]|uniref:zinc-binding dehydrogenase n=1 Tax=Inquilinus sp. Marseille-Q2685 TaxID=2866581 RepID=UPI002103126C|nr:zinc-binding dehydrogenase [Inquilinus sp. Marseille-Q2685]
MSPPDEALATAHGVSAGFVFHHTDATRLGLIAGLCDAEILTVVVDRELSLGELEAALGHVASGHARGKVLLRLA